MFGKRPLQATVNDHAYLPAEKRLICFSMQMQKKQKKAKCMQSNTKNISAAQVRVICETV